MKRGREKVMEGKIEEGREGRKKQLRIDTGSLDEEWGKEREEKEKPERKPAR